MNDTWRHKDGSIRVDHMDSRPGDYFGPDRRSDDPRRWEDGTSRDRTDEIRVAVLGERIAELEAQIERMMQGCPYCWKHEGGGISPCRLHGGAETSYVDKDADGYKFICPNCLRPNTEVHDA